MTPHAPTPNSGHHSEEPAPEHEPAHGPAPEHEPAHGPAPEHEHEHEPASEPEPAPGAAARSELEVQVRFGDTDALGHVNNVAFAAYAELGRVELMRRVRWDRGGPILARIAIDFHAQLLLGTRVVVVSEAARIGRSSIDVHQEILADGRKVATVESVVVWFDYQAQRPVRVPEEVRLALSGES